ncbi:unnamed protein product [Didymodactylos carnosus]|uniref:Uncharacterized protein n=1 Tax=Didymodactylos carnosus TaxID=1234261 RepID=A0A815TVL9_9BILA|nr:unnamed protein product [Didymodactylos carnosus]CAF1513608.1 unnamed protein product [Didymodactylos carnosus]CAF3961370.1 unnamed protein product [Didymodactylos carnosus]CAF4373945.1 unnamed protein product [Didymodactylos carnosus]
MVATRKKELALISAGDGFNRPSLESILFEITINNNVAAKTKPFADITNMSNFGTGEEEILLSMGSLLLRQMGEYKKAEKYYQMMLDELPIDHCRVSVILNNMGILYSDMGSDKKALKYYKKSYESCKMQNVSENDLLLANLYHNMGSLYHENNDNETALKYFRKAFEICNNNSSYPVVYYLQHYIQISVEYLEIMKIFNALYELQSTFEIQKRILPSLRIAATYNNIGGVYLCKGDYEKALQNFETALDIGLKSLPSDHENMLCQTYCERIKLAKERIK